MLALPSTVSLQRFYKISASFSRLILHLQNTAISALLKEQRDSLSMMNAFNHYS